MNCIIPGVNIKVLAKTLHALAKISEELFIEANQDKLSLYAFNQSKTICAQFHFQDLFFSHYNIDNNESQINYKVQMKALLPLFKGAHLEKKIDYIKLEYQINNDFIYLKVKYKCDDLTMIHKLHLMESEILNVRDICQKGRNNICAGGNFYNNLLALFSSANDDITFEFAKDKVITRNYCTGEPFNSKFVRSQVTLNSSEFIAFDINNETGINFSLKPFKAAIQFADAFNLNIGINFEEGGKPLTIIMNNPSFEATFIVATLNPNSDEYGIPCTTKTINLNKDDLQQQNITQEDLDFLINEKWGDFDDETKKQKITNNNNFSKNKNKSYNQQQTNANAEEEHNLNNTKQAMVKIIFSRSYQSDFDRQKCKVLLQRSDSE